MKSKKNYSKINVTIWYIGNYGRYESDFLFAILRKYGTEIRRLTCLKIMAIHTEIIC